MITNQLSLSRALRMQFQYQSQHPSYFRQLDVLLRLSIHLQADHIEDLSDFSRGS